MDSNSFMKLVEENNGFEFVLGFKDFVDHYIGGRGNKYWYQITKGNNSEYYVGTFSNEKWRDKFYKSKSNKIISCETVEPETTIKKIVERAYFYKDKIGTKTPRRLEKDDDVFLHYVYGFGERAWQVSEKYGITVFFSDINHEENGYNLREINIGSSVNKPKEN